MKDTPTVDKEASGLPLCLKVSLLEVGDISELSGDSECQAKDVTQAARCPEVWSLILGAT